MQSKAEAPIKFSVLSTLHLCRGKKTSLPKPSSHPRLASEQCDIRQYIALGLEKKRLVGRVP